MAKQNIFTRFDSIVKNAGLGRKYALHAYMRYTDLFTKEEREQVESFRKLYNESGNNITVMESAGYSDNQIDIIDRFVSFCQGLPSTRFTGWLRWLFSRRRTIQEREHRLQNSAELSASKQKKRKPIETEKDFLENRYYSQQQFFSKKSGEFRDTYHRNQKRIMLFSVSVSVISVLSVFVGNVVCSVFHFESSPEWLVNGFSLLVAVISAVTAYISSNDKLFQNLDFWTRYRVASEKLKSEYALYQGRCGDYDIPNDTADSLGHTQAEKKFRENVENIVQEANDNFSKLLQNGKSKVQLNLNEEEPAPAPKPKSVETTPPPVTLTEPPTPPQEVVMEYVPEEIPDDVPGGYGDDNVPVSDEPAPEPVSDDEFAEPGAEG